MRKYLPIDGTTLERELNSKALLESDITKNKAYLEKRAKFKAKDEKINTLEDRIEHLEKMITALLKKANCS